MPELPKELLEILDIAKGWNWPMIEKTAKDPAERLAARVCWLLGQFVEDNPDVERQMFEMKVASGIAT